jgi:hypothetical protein
LLLRERTDDDEEIARMDARLNILARYEMKKQQQSRIKPNDHFLIQEEQEDEPKKERQQYQSYAGGEGGRDPSNPLVDAIFGIKKDDDDGEDKPEKPTPAPTKPKPTPPPAAPKKEEYYVLYCYSPPDIHAKQFIPYRTGVIGIYRTLQEATQRRLEIITKNQYEYRGFQLFIGYSKIINDIRDYSYPLGYNEAF